LTDRPLVAIGGITRGNVQAVLAAGADSVAIIGDLFVDGGNVRARTQEWVSLTRVTQNVDSRGKRAYYGLITEKGGGPV
jgi:thiamine monophosphate synthase